MTTIKVTKIMSTFGERLKSARNSAKLTQVELARLVGVDQSSVSEAEASGMSSTKVLEYAKALNVNPYWLNTGKGSRDKDASHSLDEFKQAFDNANDSQKRLVLVLLNNLKETQETQEIKEDIIKQVIPHDIIQAVIRK